jgi:hypothetical protein
MIQTESGKGLNAGPQNHCGSGAQSPLGWSEQDLGCSPETEPEKGLPRLRINLNLNLPGYPLSMPAMNLTRIFSTIAAVGLSAAFASNAAADTPIPIDQNETLQVVVHDNVMRKTRDSWTSDRMERERFVIMRDALKRSAKKFDYDGPIKVERFAGGVKDADQQLTLYVYRWEEGIESFGRSMTVEFAMEATLRIGDEEWDMGAFTARSSHHATGGPSPEDFRPAAERAIDQLVELYRAAIQDAATSGK